MAREAPRTAKGHEEPFARQFSIFLVNRVGQMKDLMDLLHDRQVDLVGMSIIDSTDWAVARAIFSEPEKAKLVLAEADLAFTETEVLLAELADDAAMCDICGHLLRGEISIHFAFSLMLQSRQRPVVAFHVDDSVLAKQILLRHGVRLLGEEDLADPGSML
jgi:hypothetical protein